MFHFIKRIKNAFHPEINRTDLITLISGLSADNLAMTRIESLKGLMFWLRLPIKTPEQDEKLSSYQARSVRFKFLMQFLERNPAEAANFISFIKDFTKRGLAIRLFCLTGVSENQDFFGELKERIVQKSIPLAYGENDLAEIFKDIFTEEEDAIWIEECYAEILPPLINLLSTSSDFTDNFMADLDDSILMISSQISALGTSREFRRRLSDLSLAESPFIQISRATGREKISYQEILMNISSCRVRLQKVRNGLESSGVSVDLIYQMEKVSSLLDRLEMLIYLRYENEGQSNYQIISYFISKLIRDEIKRTGIREFLKENLQMVTKKIVERAGEKGDYYIAHTSEQKSKLFNAGAWAGVITSFAALFKVLIGHLKLPFLIEGIFFFINYGIAFLMMQYWHLALSSKLPAFTASALSKKFEDFIATKEISVVITEVRQIFRSQYIAAVGNLLWVIPVCLGIDWILQLTSGRPLMTQSEALISIKKHNLIQSGTVFYAFLTGILLWLSSIIAGAVENWLIFRNIPHILRESPSIHRLFPHEKVLKLSQKLPSFLGSVAGNLSISFFLAFPVVLGSISGIPLDIRHVTLSTGTLTFAFNALNWDLALWPSMVSMLMSIMVMGVLNFGVSFYCALKLAAIARGVEAKYIRIIFKFLFQKTPK